MMDKGSFPVRERETIQTREDAMRLLTCKSLSNIVPYLTPFQSPEDETYFVNCVVCARKLIYGIDFFKSICLKIRDLLLCHPFCLTCSLTLPNALNCCSCNDPFDPTTGVISTMTVDCFGLPVAKTAYACCSVECDKLFVKHVLKNSHRDGPIEVAYECEHCKEQIKHKPLLCLRCKFARYCGIECLRANNAKHTRLCNASITYAKKRKSK
jgi:hypothetical protein